MVITDSSYADLPHGTAMSGAKRTIKHAVWGGKEQKDCNC